MTRLTNWTRESRTPTLAYRNTETDARAALHQAPDPYVHTWRAAILVEGYPVWSRGFATKEASSLRDELEKRLEPELRCLFGLEQGTKLMVVPTDHGLVPKKLDLPSVEEFQQRVEEHAETVDLSMDAVSELVDETRGSDR